MKRKAWIIATVCLAVVLLAYACLVGLAVWQGNGLSEALYIETRHGHMLLIEGSPISMSGKEGLFDDLTMGDKVLVVHGPIAESYPGQAKAYLCIKQADGTEEDIPERVRVSLLEMGWLSYETPINEKDAIMIANVYTWHCFDIVTTKQNPETGDWAVEMWSEDRENHETVYISADGTKVNIASGTIYR